jgi:hypothetical protein
MAGHPRDVYESENGRRQPGYVAPASEQVGACDTQQSREQPDVQQSVVRCDSYPDPRQRSPETFGTDTGRSDEPVKLEQTYRNRKRHDDIKHNMERSVEGDHTDYQHCRTGGEQSQEDAA